MWFHLRHVEHDCKYTTVRHLKIRPASSRFYTRKIRCSSPDHNRRKSLLENELRQSKPAKNSGPGSGPTCYQGAARTRTRERRAGWMPGSGQGSGQGSGGRAGCQGSGQDTRDRPGSGPNAGPGPNRRPMSGMPGMRPMPGMPGPGSGPDQSPYQGAARHQGSERPDLEPGMHAIRRERGWVKCGEKIQQTILNRYAGCQDNVRF